MARSKNKTLPKIRERNEEICEQSRGVIAVPAVVKPVVVPIPRPVVEVQITDIQVVGARVAVCMERLPSRHYPLNTLGVEYYSAS